MCLLYPPSCWSGKQRSHIGQRTHLRTLHDGSLKLCRWTVAVCINVMCDARRGHVNRRTTRNKQHAAPNTGNAMTLERRATTSAETTKSTAMHASRCDKAPRLNQQLAKPLEKIRRNISARKLMRWVEPTDRKTERTRLCAQILADGKVRVMRHTREVA